MKVGNHNYFLSWREPWHKFEVNMVQKCGYTVVLLILILVCTVHISFSFLLVDIIFYLISNL